MKKLIAGFIRDETGTTAIEFGLISIAFLTLVFGVFETGRLVLTQNALQYSLENATRYALVTEDVTEDELGEYIAADMTAMTLDTSKMDVNIDFADNSGIDFIEISGTYDFTPMMLAFLPESWTNITVTANSRMPVQECSNENCPWTSDGDDDDESSDDDDASSP